MRNTVVHLLLLLFLMLLLLRLWSSIIQFSSEEFEAVKNYEIRHGGKLNLQSFLLADRFDSCLAATVVDVEDGKACED